MSFATTFKLEGEALDLANPAVLVINRGTEPSSIELLVRDEDGGGTRFDDIENPVTISITAPDKYGNNATLELKKWHIIYSSAAGPGLVKLILEDNRKIARDTRVTAEYNIQVASIDEGETFRDSSLNNGQQWYCLDAAIDAIEKFGLKYTRAKQLQRSVKFVKLPANLGNSAAGGFVSAQWDQMLPLLLDPIHCDPVINKDGSVSIVDRQSEASVNISAFMGVEGTVHDVDKHWIKPQKIVCEFETRIARQFRYEEGHSVVRGKDIEIEMVIPDADTSGNIFGFTEFYDEIQRAGGISRREVLDRWLKPRVVDVDTDNDASDVLAAKDQLEGFIRSSFRQLFRIDNEGGLDGMSDLAIGHLKFDGTTRTTHAVYMPYAFVHKFTRVGKGAKLKDYWETVVSTNVPFTYTRSAPWNAQLGVNDYGEIMLFLLPEVGGFTGARDLIPGQTLNPMRVGDAVDIIDDNHILPTQGQTKLSSGWIFRVVYHGLLIKDRDDLGIDRLHKETNTGFSGGKVPELVYRVSDMTANYGYTDAASMALDLPTLLNEDELAIRAEAVTEQVKRNFKDGKAGIYTTAGVDAIVNGDYWVRGNIHSMSIVIGAKRPHSVEAKWVVMPEVRPVYANNLNLQGLPVRLIR